jgi:lysozyme family protein
MRNMDTSFKKALKRTLVFEGGYVNDPDDRGGETIFGISRVHHPKLQLWNELDRYKKYESQDISRLEDLMKNNNSIEDFYMKEYWYRYKCNLVYSDSYKVAEYLFDCVVNHGSGGVKILQNALNSLGTQTQYKPLVVDGSIGPKTLERLSLLTEFINTADLLDRFKEHRVKFYTAICKRDSSQLKYINGWMNRTFGVLRDVA